MSSVPLLILQKSESCNSRLMGLATPRDLRCLFLSVQQDFSGAPLDALPEFAMFLPTAHTLQIIMRVLHMKTATMNFPVTFMTQYIFTFYLPIIYI